MVWVGSFKSLQAVLSRPWLMNAPLEVHTWVPTNIGLISPLVDRLMSLIAASRCVHEKEEFVELALREALSNAMLHGNRLGSRKLVHVRCCCDGSKGSLLSSEIRARDLTRLRFPILWRSKIWPPSTGPAST